MESVSLKKLEDVSMISHIKSTDTVDTSALKSRRTKDQRKKKPYLSVNDDITPVK